jgi:ribosomal protein S17E
MEEKIKFSFLCKLIKKLGGQLTPKQKKLEEKIDEEFVNNYEANKKVQEELDKVKGN